MIILDALLQGHAQRAGLVVFLKKLLDRVYLRNILPAAAVERLQKRRQPDVIDNALPVDGKREVPQTLADDAFDVIFLRQQHGFGNSDARESCGCEQATRTGSA